MGNSTKKQKIIVICGPTGSGKSSIALSLCEEYNGAIISADSRQVYKELHIGTGKEIESDDYQITKRDDWWIINGIDVYGYDIVSAHDEFSVSHFEQEVFTSFLPKISTSQKIPFLVGGTGFYIQAIIDGIETIGIPQNNKLRAELEEEYQNQGIDVLVNKLLELDSSKAETIDRDNPYRIIRAIEIEEAKKQGFNFQKVERNFDVLFIGITGEREKLYEKIDARVDSMIEAGLLQEIENLLNQGFGWESQAMKSIGYGEFQPYIEKEQSLEECVQKLKWNTHAYVRRQLTWFRRDKRIKWFSLEKEHVKKEISNSVFDFLGKE